MISFRRPVITVLLSFMIGIMGIVMFPRQADLISWCCCATMLAFLCFYILIMFFINRLR